MPHPAGKGRKGYRRAEPFAKDTEVQNIPNVSFEEVLKADYLVITLGHTLFKENKDKIAEKPYFDCVGMME